MQNAPNPADADILQRAGRVIELADFGPLAASTAVEYRRAAARLADQFMAAGSDWRGLDAVTGSDCYRSALRAAWTRLTHAAVAAALRDLKERRVPAADALARLRRWVPEAEAYPPRPGTAHLPPPVRRNPPRPRPPSRSKRGAIKLLGSDWLGRLWSAAVDRGFRHIDALAVLMATGARPAEVCGEGVSVHRCAQGLEIIIRGAKVHGSAGQPWRSLVVAVEGGAAEHLARLAEGQGDEAVVAAACSPNALSMAIADLAAQVGFQERVSAYDLRHQRAADFRIAFAGDLEKCAAAMGHSSDQTLRYYGRLPRSAGVRGPRPLAVSVPRPVRRPGRTPGSDPQPAGQTSR